MSEENILSVFESASVASLRPGDVLLFKCPRELSPQERAKASEVLDEVFGDFEIMILDGGQDIAILRPESGILARMWGRLFSRKVTA